MKTQPGEPTVTERLEALEKRVLKVKDLPLTQLQRRLELDWLPDAVADLTVTDETRTVYGTVNSGGTIASGVGFTSSRTGVGTYVVAFTPAFRSTAVPTVVPAAGATAGAITAKVSVTPNAAGFTVSTFTTTTGANIDSVFGFVAIGIGTAA